jgi:hypothetical protein
MPPPVRRTPMHVLVVTVDKVGLSSAFLGQKLLSLAAQTSCPCSTRKLASPAAASKHAYPFREASASA